jgi:hypothetical protein
MNKAIDIAGPSYAQRSNCPCCGIEVSRAVKEMASAPPAESLPLDQHGKFLSGYSAARIFFTYFRCASCQLLFCPTYYSDRQLNQLYGHQSENMGEVPLEARVRTQRHYVNLVAPESLPEGDYLELGADIGLFTRECIARKRFRHLRLYEPNQSVRGQLQSRLMGAPHTIYERTFTEEDVIPASGALATAIHVLDHVWQPLELLRQLHDSLMAGGRILIVTHDERSTLARVLGRRWPPFTLQHPQLYSADSLVKTLKRSGFRNIRIEKTVNFFPPLHLAQAALQVLNVPVTLPRWSVGQIPIALGNIAAIAEK